MITRYKRPPVPPGVAWLCDDAKTVIDETGHRSTFDNIDKRLTIYGPRDAIIERAESGDGALVYWSPKTQRGRTPIRWEHRGRSVIPLTDPPSDDEALAGVIAWRDWAAANGAAISSIGSTAYSLLRATIEAPLFLGGAEAPPLREIVGGRQFSPALQGSYKASSWDLRGAYSNMIGHMPYGARWVQIEGGVNEDPGCLVYCHARVRMPPMWISPLPRRTDHGVDAIFWSPNEIAAGDYPSGTRLQGIWSYDELRSAWEVGATVTIDRSWINPSERQPFLPWLEAIERGRELEGFAGKLVKLTGARLWGRFGMGEGQRLRVRWSDGAPASEVALPHLPPFQRDLALAEAVTSGVRTRLWREGIAPNRERLIGGHTDSIILVGAERPASLNDDWRCKFEAKPLRWMGPQSYAWRDGDHWIYKISGLAGWGKPEETFPDMWRFVKDAGAMQAPKEIRERFALVKKILGAERDFTAPDVWRWRWGGY